MKLIIALCLTITVASLSNRAHAHMYGKEFRVTLPTGLYLPGYEWHADSPWSSAVIYNARTNLGPWVAYPDQSLTRQPVEGSIWPVEPQRWYRTRFYHTLTVFTQIAGTVFIAADICGVGQDTKDK